MTDIVQTLVDSNLGAVSITGKLGGKHPADGLTAQVNIGGGAVMTIQNPQSFIDGGVGWKLNYGNTEGVKHAAISLMQSYDYLISSEITMKEATSRLRMLRAARRSLWEEGTEK
jgi:hypothetical protein